MPPEDRTPLQLSAGQQKTVRHMVEYLLPGWFMPEKTTRELPERSAEAAVALAPEGAYCFQFYDSPIVDFEFDAARFRVLPIAQNKSKGRYYIGGEVFTPDDLRSLAVAEGDPGKYRTLIANVECNDWGRAIRCRCGNWQPFEEGDEVVEPTHGQGRKP